MQCYIAFLDVSYLQQPLFLYLPFQAVHSANGNSILLQAPTDLIKRFDYIENKQRRTYAGMFFMVWYIHFKWWLYEDKRA